MTNQYKQARIEIRPSNRAMGLHLWHFFAEDGAKEILMYRDMVFPEDEAEPRRYREPLGANAPGDIEGKIFYGQDYLATLFWAKEEMVEGEDGVVRTNQETGPNGRVSASITLHPESKVLERLVKSIPELENPRLIWLSWKGGLPKE